MARKLPLVLAGVAVTAILGAAFVTTIPSLKVGEAQAASAAAPRVYCFNGAVNSGNGISRGWTCLPQGNVAITN